MRNNQIIPSTRELRENVSHRLSLAVTKVGSVTEISQMIGVNRTQFNRYLSGKSMPRPEILYQLSLQLDLPLEWFFSSDPDFKSELAVLQFGSAMSELVRGRDFQIMDDVVQDGFYLLWKGMFNQASGAEALICSVTSYAGVKKIKLSIRRALADEGVIDGLSTEHYFINGVMFKSSEGILTLFSESRYLIPRFDGAIFSLEWKEALWDKYFTAAPRPRTPSEQQYSDPLADRVMRSMIPRSASYNRGAEPRTRHQCQNSRQVA